MTQPTMTVFRLAPRGRLGLACDEKGVTLGPVALIDALSSNGKCVYRPRPPEEIACTSALAYGPFSADDLARRLSGLDVAARALEAGDLAKAGIATVLLKLPPLTAEAFAKLALEPTLKKYAAPSFLSKSNPYHKPAGTRDGGQFTNAEGAAAGSSMEMADAEGAGGPAPPRPPGRKLRPGEIERARSIFGDRINYDCVRIHRDKFLQPNIFGNQKDKEIVTPNGEIYYPPANSLYRPDLSAADPSTDLCAREIFIHEMTHVLQYQAGVSVKTRELKNSADRVYGYQLDKEKPFRNYGLEQQASIVEDYSRIREGYAPVHLGADEEGGGNCHSTRKLNADEKQALRAQYESLLKVDEAGHITALVADDDPGRGLSSCSNFHPFDPVPPTAKPDDPETLPEDAPSAV